MLVAKHSFSKAADHLRQACVVACLSTMASLIACGTPAGINPHACDDDVLLRVSAGLMPEVSWSPACTAAQLVIDSAPPDPPSSRAHFVWFLDSSPDDQGVPMNRLRTPVNYSTRPAGVVVQVEPRRLVPGVHYRVTITAYKPEGGLSINSHDFVP